MKIRTLAAVVAAPSEAVFRLLADIEALPRWAPSFCERVDLVAGSWVALTNVGELSCAISANERHGTIDLLLGADAAAPSVMPIRVLPLAAGRTLVSVAVHETAVRCDGHFHRLCSALRRDLARLRRHLGGATGRREGKSRTLAFAEATGAAVGFAS
jgi:hypothetical protein